MRRIPAVLLAPAVLLSACGTDGAGTPSTVMTEPSAAVGGTALPISGRCQGSFEIIPIDFLPPPLDEFAAHGRAVYQGTCQIAHLGRSATAGEDLLDFTTDPFTGEGTRRFTAANRDELRADVEIAVPQPGESKTFTTSGTLTFNGGTGRFRNATGSARFTGGGVIEDGTNFYSFKGTLSLAR
jgi:hypothetical protein